MKLMYLSVSILVLGGLLIWLVRRYERNQVYHPSKILENTPKSLGLKYQDLRFPSGEETLQGWYIPAKNCRGTLLYCHGNSGNLSDCLETIKIYHEMGLNVLVFDYRGYGNSTGIPSEQGTYQDAQATWDEAVNNLGVDPQKLIIFGRSLGGAVAINLASHNPARGLIVEASFPSLMEVARIIHPHLPVGLMLSYHYPSAQLAANLKMPKLFIHSNQDELVPLGLGKKLLAAASEPKTFLEISGSHGEGFLETGAKYREGVNLFLSEILGPGPQQS